MQPITNLPADHYLDLIRNNKPFQLSRFGDGEAICAFPHSWLKENCDGSAFTKDIIEPMRQIFRNKYDYYHCLLDCTFDRTLAESTDKFRAFLEETCPDMPFYNGEIWQYLSIDEGRITELVETLSLHYSIFVGAPHLLNVEQIHGMRNCEFICVPERNAFKVFDELFEKIMEAHAEGHRMFCFSAGYVTKPLIDTLFPYIGHDTFLIDFGSMFDPYCGKMSRDGMKFVGKEYFQQFTKYKL